MQPKGGDSVEIWTRRLNKLFAESQETYRDIAKATGIPISAIHRYVTGETENIPLDRLEQLAAHFGVKTEYLAGWDREPDAVDRKVLEIDPEFVPGKGYLPENNNDINIYREKMRRQPGMRMLFDAADGATQEQYEQFAKVIKAMRDD